MKIKRIGGLSEAADKRGAFIKARAPALIKDCLRKSLRLLIMLLFYLRYINESEVNSETITALKLPPLLT